MQIMCYSYVHTGHVHMLQSEREREKLYIFSSHLGLIRCLTPIRVSAIIYSQAFLDKHRNTTNVILPHELKHGSGMLSKQALISVTNILQPWALKHNMLFITRVFTSTQCAYPMQPGDTVPTTKIPGKVMATHPEPEQGLHTPSGQWQPEYCLGMDVGRPCKPCTIRTKTGTLRGAVLGPNGRSCQIASYLAFSLMSNVCSTMRSKSSARIWNV